MIGSDSFVKDVPKLIVQGGNYRPHYPAVQVDAFIAYQNARLEKADAELAQYKESHDTAALSSHLDRQAIRKEALQEALGAVKGERLSSHAGLGDGSLRPTETYSQAIRNVERALLAKIEEVK